LQLVLSNHQKILEMPQGLPPSCGEHDHGILVIPSSHPPNVRSFGVSKVEYLSHIVNHDGVQVDPKKVATMKDRPHPKTLKSSRGLLGLIGYYKNFGKKIWKIFISLILSTQEEILCLE
jgi:hypothetical protein